MKDGSIKLHAIASGLRRRIAGEVIAVFNDARRGERPVERMPDAIFSRSSVVWRVHGDVGSMMIGGVAGLLLQMLHPSVLAGVWDHSDFRSDMHGRLRRTARFIALTTYGSRSRAEAAIARVRSIHEVVAGALPDGRPYAANDPALLAWVHATEALSFLTAWIRYGDPLMPALQQDRYFDEFAEVALALGADPVPRSRAAAEQLVRDMRPQLRVDERTRAVARLVLSQRPVQGVPSPVARLMLRAGVDLLPAWARQMHGLAAGPSRYAVRAGAYGLARTVRWAFAA
jgi:uncharacterized protein (DUF2236 family)